MNKHPQCNYVPLQITNDDEKEDAFRPASFKKTRDQSAMTLAILAFAAYVCYITIQKMQRSNTQGISLADSSMPTLSPTIKRSHNGINPSTAPNQIPSALAVHPDAKFHTTFPGMADETCLYGGRNECATRVAVELYKYWNDETQSLDDPPFSPVFYDTGMTVDASNMEGWRFGDCLPDIDSDCKTFAQVVKGATEAHCPMQDDISSISFFVNGAKEFFFMGWNRKPCSERVVELGEVVRDDLVFFDGQKKGYLVEINPNTAYVVYVEDPRADSCWSFQCKIHGVMDACVEEIQTGFVELSVADFYDKIMNIGC